MMLIEDDSLPDNSHSLCYFPSDIESKNQISMSLLYQEIEVIKSRLDKIEISKVLFVTKSIELTIITSIGNKLREEDKEFETSYLRMIIIMLITYGTICGYMALIGINEPLLNAIVPTIGFNLSTWGLNWVRLLYKKIRNKNNSYIFHFYP